MKKVKLKLKYDELQALYDFIQSSVGVYPAHLPKSYVWTWRLVQSVMILWSLKLQQKLVFKKQKPFTMSLDIPTASAFMLFFGWDDTNPATYFGNTVIRIQNEIQQQLA